MSTRQMVAVVFLLYGMTVSCTKKNTASSSPSNEISRTNPSWKTWTKKDEPDWKGQIHEGGGYMAGDPTAIKIGSTYHLYYSCYGTEPASAIGIASSICHVTSSDGHTWNFAPSSDPNFKGVVFKGQADSWDQEIETADIVRQGSTFNLYYSGYEREVDGTRPPAKIGLATSTDGNVFTRMDPVLTPTPLGRDSDDLFSPAVYFVGQLLHVVYTGWCVDGYHDGANCSQGPAIQLLGAAKTEGNQWLKEADPILPPKADISWLRLGAAEPDMLVGPDGYFYLFITGGLADDEARVTGIARSRSPSGPWDINPQPIIKPTGHAGAFDACGTFAPTVILDSDIVRMWYLGLDDCNATCPSCDFAACGCQGSFAIGYAETTWPLKSER